MNDHFGSDADYDSYHGRDWSLDEREDWCEAHQQRQTTCGKCHAEGALTERELDESEMVAAVVAAMSQVTARIK